MKRLIRYAGCGALILGLLVLLFLSGSIGLVVVPVEIAFHLSLGWIQFLLRVLPDLHVNFAAIGFFLAASLLAVAGIHWMGRSLSAARGVSWNGRWSLAIYATLWLLFLTAMGITGAAHQAGWLWRSGESWIDDGRLVHFRDRDDMERIARTIQQEVYYEDPDAADIYSAVIAQRRPHLETCYFQVFPPHGRSFRAALVVPRSREVLERQGFVLLQKKGQTTVSTDLKAEELDAALQALTSGNAYPASDPTQPGATDH